LSEKKACYAEFPFPFGKLPPDTGGKLALTRTLARPFSEPSRELGRALSVLL
jgi:hypothetical protein